MSFEYNNVLENTRRIVSTRGRSDHRPQTPQVHNQMDRFARAGVLRHHLNRL